MNRCSHAEHRELVQVHASFGSGRCVQDEAKRHELVRADVREVICVLCDTRQPVSRSCTKCSTSFGEYSCLICNFWEDDLSKGHWHCEGCGLCRVGGQDNFFHCSTCGCCYAKALQVGHEMLVCQEQSTVY